MLEFTNEAKMKDLLLRRLQVDIKRTSAEIVNKCAAQTLIGAKGVQGAVHLTPKATTGRIRSDLNRRYPAWTFEGKSHSVKLLYILASKSLKNKGRKFGSFAWWNAQVADEAERIFKARDSSRAFLAAGWLPAVADLGFNKHRALGVSRPQGRASRGRATRATPGRLTAICYNAAVERRGGGNDNGAYAIADAALQKAIQLALYDLEKYVVRKETEAKLRERSD